MNYSKDGMKLTEGFEQCRLVSYHDIKGVLTIGWGHTGFDVYEGQTITQAEADALLLKDVSFSEYTVNHYVTIQLTQDEFDAITDLVFNIGCGAFRSSTLLRLLNQGDFVNAALEFDKWDKAGGQVVAGLLRRRQAETALFNS